MLRWPQHVEGPVVETPASWRGLLWTVYIATMYYFMSNPLALVPAFEVSFLFASQVTILVLLVDRHPLRFPVVPWSVLLFIALGAVSMAWSISKDDTWVTTRGTVVLAALALLVTSNVSAKVLAYGIGVGGVVIVAMSLIAFWEQLPGAFIYYDVEPSVAGIGTNRNILAYVLVPALAAVLAIRPTARWEPPAIVVLAAISGWGIWLAASGTGLLAAASVILVAVGLRLVVASRRVVGPRGPVVVLVAMAVMATVAATNLALLARIVGRDLDTLSGRRPLWSAIIDISQDRLIEGYGFGAVWNHPWHAADLNPVLTAINTKANYAAPHGHNSFMDVLPELGLLGCVAVLLIFGQALIRALRPLVTPSTPASLETSRLVVLVSLAHVASGLSEPLATVPFGWYVLVLVAGVSLHLGSERLALTPTRPEPAAAAVEPAGSTPTVEA